ncbi:MAG: HNH endonuclease [Pseudomonadota bacterium]
MALNRLRTTNQLQTIKPSLNALQPAIGMQPKRWGGGRGGRPWRRKREAIALRDQYTCQMHKALGQWLVVDLPDGICDHIIPEFEGGTDEESNLQWVCKSCSDAKTLDESNRAQGR